MRCIHCRERNEDEPYIAYGGVLFCDLDCLAEFYVENEMDTAIEKVEDGYEWREQS